MSQSVDDLYRFGLKLFVEPGISLNGGDCIPIFHRWIQAKSLDRLLIDVADYTHLVGGPSVLLVGYEGNLSVDYSDGRSGIVCTSKRPEAADSLPDRIVSVARTLFVAASLLESDEAFDGRLRFVLNELQFQANDRLLAPLGTNSAAVLEPSLQTFMETLYPHQSHHIGSSPSQTGRVKIGLKAPEQVSLVSLLERVGQTIKS